MQRDRTYKRFWGAASGWLVAVTLVGAAAVPASSQSSEPALPTDPVVIDIDAPEQQVFRMAIPRVRGSASKFLTQATQVLERDFQIMPGFRVIRDQSIPASLKASSSFNAEAWGRVRAHGVITGEIRRSSTGFEADMRFYRLSEGSAAMLHETYRGRTDRVREWMHAFANEVLRVLTGERGVFGTKIAFARKHGAGRKDVYIADMDGHGVRRVSRGTGVSMLPAFGSGRLWYTRMVSGQMFITHGRSPNVRVIRRGGINMGGVECDDGRLYFTSTRDGNSEIYSSNGNGGDVRRLTRSRAIDLSPTCGPGGKLAFVSRRHGSPQIFTMNRDGSRVKRVTFRGTYNQTPSWCRHPDKPLIAFTGRHGGLDVFTVNLETKEYTRVTQGQGQNKDPAFSPDCRMLAFSSTRRGKPGIYLAAPDGTDQVRVISGRAETIRWRH